jgi:hypothetical protein
MLKCPSCSTPLNKSNYTLRKFNKELMYTHSYKCPICDTTSDWYLGKNPLLVSFGKIDEVKIQDDWLDIT